MCTEPSTPLTWQIKVLNVTLCIGLNYFLFLSTLSTWYYIIFVQPCKIPCSMQHGLLTPPTYTGSCKVAFLANQFWWEDSLNISDHLPDSWPELSPLIFADSCPGYQNYPVLTGLAVKLTNSLSSLIDFREIRPVWHFDTSNIEITYKFIFTVSDLIMPKPVYLLTVHEAHKEYNSLIDQIWAKYELLDSGECGSVGTPAFNAECSKLAHLMARMSKLCKHLNLPMSKELHRPPHFKHWSALNSKFICGRFS